MSILNIYVPNTYMQVSLNKYFLESIDFNTLISGDITSHPDRKSTVFIGCKDQYCENSCHAIYKFHTISIKIPLMLFIEISKTILIFI